MGNTDTIDVGGCQNYDPFLGTLNSKCCIIIWYLSILEGTAFFRKCSVLGFARRCRALEPQREGCRNRYCLCLLSDSLMGLTGSGHVKRNSKGTLRENDQIYVVLSWGDEGSIPTII